MRRLIRPDGPTGTKGRRPSVRIAHHTCQEAEHPTSLIWPLGRSHRTIERAQPTVQLFFPRGQVKHDGNIISLLSPTHTFFKYFGTHQFQRRQDNSYIHCHQRNIRTGQHLISCFQDPQYSSNSGYSVHSTATTLLRTTPSFSQVLDHCVLRMLDSTGRRTRGICF